MLNPSDFKIRNGRFVVLDTGAAIPMDGDFWRDVYRAGRFIIEVRAIAASRVIKPSKTKPITIAFLPNYPRPWYAIWPVCQLAGLKTIDDPKQADILFYFEDRITATSEAHRYPGKRVLNGECEDIRKSRVADAFQQVFGYELKVDPLTHHGLALEKSELNGVHDGKIVTCPLAEAKPEAVYQKLVDSSQGDDIYTDIRTPIVGGTIPTIYLKQRKSDARFSNDNFRVMLSTPDENFSPLEQQQIADFAKAMKLDFGGLDVLRDRADGRIYIVDVNKTDMGPPTALPRKDKHAAMRLLAAAFDKFVREILTSKM